MKISIANLSEGSHAFHFTAEPAHLGLSDYFTKPVSVDVTIEKTNREVFLKAAAKTSGRFSCDRCADEFDREVRTAYQMMYIYDEREKQQPHDEEVQVISSVTTAIDIADDVREFILLAVPQKLLCSDSCKGLCPHCGTNRNRGSCSCSAEEVDPQWGKLKSHFQN